MRMTVGYNKVWGILMLGVSGINLVTYMMTHRWMQLALVVMFTLIGVLYLVGQALVIEGNEVQMKNPMGMTLKRYPLRSLSDLEFEGKTLYVKTPQGGKLRVMSGMMVHGPDVERLRTAIAQATRTT
jgi:hypothetical protein